MENHPIPQDVTGFQFKLIGNMTVKQFAYLATGAVFAWILYQIPVFSLLKFLLCAISVAAGAAFAYLPIGGRPMDVMIGNYVKALVRPTEFIYRKDGGQIYIPSGISAVSVKKITQYTNQNQGLGLLPQDQLRSYLRTFEPKTTSQMGNQVNYYTNQMGTAANVTSEAESTTPNNSTPATPRVLSYSENQAAAWAAPQPILMTYKDLQQKQGSKVYKVKDPADNPEPKQEVVQKPTIVRSETQKTASPAQKTTSGNVGVFDFPNLITGTVKDPRGNPLPNILVEVKDKEGNPVRAFKTNEFGRFASATPLINGNYTIEFEDPKLLNKFEKITISATGQVISPVEMISVDTREELRRSLFTTQTN